jgi:hypothetical protein
LTGRPDSEPELGAPWLVPPPARAYDDPAEAAFSAVRRTPHPVGCFTERVRLSRPLEDHPFTRTYIRATADGPSVPFDAAAARARASAAWRYRELPTTHLVAQDRPRELVDLLLELV